MENAFGGMNISGDHGWGDDYYLIRDMEGDFVWLDKSDPYQKQQKMTTIENGIPATLNRVDNIIGNRYKNAEVWNEIYHDPTPGNPLLFKISVKRLVEIDGYRMEVDLEVVRTAFRILAPYYLLKYYTIVNFDKNEINALGLMSPWEYYKTLEIVPPEYWGLHGPVVINLWFSVDTNYSHYYSVVYHYALHNLMFQLYDLTEDFYTIYHDIMTQGNQE